MLFALFQLTEAFYHKEYVEPLLVHFWADSFQEYPPIFPFVLAEPVMELAADVFETCFKVGREIILYKVYKQTNTNTQKPTQPKKRNTDVESCYRSS